MSEFKTRIIVETLPDGRTTWRAPIVDGRSANVEIRPTRPAYENEASARAAGELLVRSILPDIVFE